MPNIVEYNSTSNLTPSDKGIQAAEQAARVYAEAGRSLDHTFSQLGDQVEKHMTLMESSELYKTLPQMELGLKQNFDEESAKHPDDPHFMNVWMERYAKPLIESWGKGVNTPGAKELLARMQGDLYSSVGRHAYAGQAAMDAAHHLQNIDEGLNGLKADVSYDPSRANTEKALGQMDNMITSGTAGIPDPEQRASAQVSYNKHGREDVMEARYEGVYTAVTKQVAQTGSAAASPAYNAALKDIDDKYGHEYMDLSTVPQKLEAAVQRGIVQYKAGNETAKAKLETEGKAFYAQGHHEMTRLIAAGQGATPEMVKFAGDFAEKYGSVLPAEAAALDDFALKGHDRVLENKDQPYNQQARDSIQGSFSLPAGDPGRPTLASLAKAWSAGQITHEDLTTYSEILNRLNSKEDPAFKAVLPEITKWINGTAQSIGAGSTLPGKGAVQARFRHDMLKAWMDSGASHGDWQKAYDYMANSKNLGFVLNRYNDALTSGDTTAALHYLDSPIPPDHQARGSVARPILPTGPRSTPSAQPAVPADDLKKADAILWGR